MRNNKKLIGKYIRIIIEDGEVYEGKINHLKFGENEIEFRVRFLSKSYELEHEGKRMGYAVPTSIVPILYADDKKESREAQKIVKNILKDKVIVREINGENPDAPTLITSEGTFTTLENIQRWAATYKMRARASV